VIGQGVLRQFPRCEIILQSNITGLNIKDSALHEHLLGMKAPWSVRSADLSLADQRAVVEVVLKVGQVWAAPIGDTKRVHINR
jgi:hypothetical protein